VIEFSVFTTALRVEQYIVSPEGRTGNKNIPLFEDNGSPEGLQERKIRLILS